MFSQKIVSVFEREGTECGIDRTRRWSSPGRIEYI